MSEPAKMSPELAFLLEREKIEEAIVEQFVAAGILTLKHFACLVPDREGMRKLAVTSFGLSDGDLIGMGKIARLICAWETAQTRSIEVNKMDAELEVRGQPKAVLANDYSAMKRAFEKQYWTLCDEKTPAKSYLERKLESLEKRELRPEKLGDVINYREDDSMELKPVWDSSGSLKAMKTACSVPLPRDSEELRSRITLLGTAWVMAAMHQTSNPLLKDLRPHIFTEYCDYLLGKHVWGLAAVGSDGRQMAHPTWTLLLQYEHEIRRRPTR